VLQGFDLSNGPDINEVVESLRERSKSLVDMAQSCAMFYNDFEDFELGQASKVFNLESKLILDDLYIQLKVLEDWNAENIHSVINNICEIRGVGFGKVGQPFRLALSGDGKAGSIDISAHFVGKKRTISRLKMAIEWINNLDS
jgi:glutamyl-tRNA synthetase